jgi:hypothetical protein
MKPYYGSVEVALRVKRRVGKTFNRAHLCARKAIEWVDATRHQKSLRRTPHVKKAWSHLFAKGRDAARALQAVAGNVAYEQLRLARVRIDITCMVLFREYFRGIPRDRLDIYIFTDGSPQWRGLEMIASSFDMVSLVNAPAACPSKTTHIGAGMVGLHMGGECVVSSMAAPFHAHSLNRSDLI